MLSKKRKARITRIRAKFSGTAKRPRVTVFRSNKKIYVQAINDTKSVTLAQANGVDSAKVGASLAADLTKLKIKEVVFDRSGYKYHGKVKQIAEAIREAGVKI